VIVSLFTKRSISSLAELYELPHPHKHLVILSAISILIQMWPMKVISAQKSSTQPKCNRARNSNKLKTLLPERMLKSQTETKKS
jgi:hypothetical protein